MVELKESYKSSSFKCSKVRDFFGLWMDYLWYFSVSIVLVAMHYNIFVFYNHKLWFTTTCTMLCTCVYIHIMLNIPPQTVDGTNNMRPELLAIALSLVRASCIKLIVVNCTQYRPWNETFVSLNQKSNWTFMANNAGTMNACIWCIKYIFFIGIENKSQWIMECY